MKTKTRALAALAIITTLAAPALAIDDEHYRRARTMIENSIDYLRSQQDAATGGWAVPEGDRPNLPAITGLVITGMLMERDIDASDPHVARGVEYILSFRQPDGGIYDRILASYNTSICLSALAKVRDSMDATQAIITGRRFLKSLQWSEDASDHPETGVVQPDHPFYGGVGYGGSSRPDNSNLNLMLQALHDTGLASDDEAYQRALVFLQRTQMVDGFNDMDYADNSDQGGFIYSTSPNDQALGEGESKAGTIEETLDDGTNVSRLRAYGSMTYAGFKSYLYADLDRDDPRVRAAYNWIRENYTLEENPGIGDDGLYYYFLTFSRALDEWGLTTIETTGGETRDWANDLIDRLSELQNEDGSFRSVNARWMEDNPVLITAYALIALQHATN